MTFKDHLTLLSNGNAATCAGYLSWCGYLFYTYEGTYQSSEIWQGSERNIHNSDIAIIQLLPPENEGILVLKHDASTQGIFFFCRSVYWGIISCLLRCLLIFYFGASRFPPYTRKWRWVDALQIGRPELCWKPRWWNLNRSTVSETDICGLLRFRGLLKFYKVKAQNMWQTNSSFLYNIFLRGPKFCTRNKSLA